MYIRQKNFERWNKMLLTRPQSQPPKVINLFAHEKFYMTRSHESDVLDLSPKEKLHTDIDEIVKYWVHLGMRTPREYRAVEVYTSAKKQLKSIILGNHPNIPKLHKGQILCSMLHFKCAATDPKFRPVKKYLLKKLSINEFIWEAYTHKSQLVTYLDPPQTLEHEVNPQLTKEIIRQYNMTKWGHNSMDISVGELPTFVRVSNRLVKYLKEVESNLQPLMGLSLKRPNLAVEGLMRSNNVTRSDFLPIWLANDISIAKLDSWLKTQGFFKTPCRVA